MSSPKTYTIPIQFGHLVSLNDITAWLATVFTGSMQSPALKRLAPDMLPGLKAARESISGPMVQLLHELIRQGVPSPKSVPKPPAYLVLHLVLPEQLVQEVGQLVTATAEALKNLEKIIQQPLQPVVLALLQRYRKEAAEVAGYWLAAMAEAGVPEIATR